jgi:hypothetical protein
LLKAATGLANDPILLDGPEVAYRKVAGDLKAEIIRNTHQIGFLLKHRTLMVEELASVHRNLDIVPSA